MEAELNQYLQHNVKISNLNEQLIVKLTHDFREHVALVEGKAGSDQKNFMPPNVVQLRTTTTVEDYQWWPKQKCIESKTREALKELRFKKVEWATHTYFGVGLKDTLSSIRFTLSDG